MPSFGSFPSRCKRKAIRRNLENCLSGTVWVIQWNAPRRNKSSNSRRREQALNNKTGSRDNLSVISTEIRSEPSRQIGGFTHRPTFLPGEKCRKRNESSQTSFPSKRRSLRHWCWKWNRKLPIPVLLTYKLTFFVAAGPQTAIFWFEFRFLTFAATLCHHRYQSWGVGQWFRFYCYFGLQVALRRWDMLAQW